MTTALQLGLFGPRSAFPTRGKAHNPPYHDPFLAANADRLQAAGQGRLKFDEDSWDYAAVGAVGLDIEVYINFLVICFKRFLDGKQIAFELSSRSKLDKPSILSILNNNTTVSFNGLAYDLLIIYLGLADTSAINLKAVSDKLIFGNINRWNAEKELGVRVPRLNHIDLMETNPAVRQGLKIIHGRLHGRFMVDLPYPPETTLTYEQMNVTTLYCFNDIDATQGMYNALREPLKLRATLGRRYGTDFRSKSDSQIGEAIVKRSVETSIGRRIGAAEIVSETYFDYAPPFFIRFSNPGLRYILNRLSTAQFYINGAGRVSPPDWLKNFQVKIGDMTYTLGIGGLHSTEAHRALRSDERNFLIDIDVASQYPNIIMKLGLYPKAMGPAFLTIYQELIKERLAAKAAKDQVHADGGRIALNGVFGKLGSSYSTLYSPRLLIAVTLSGQLAILMIIERAEAAGIPVVSANTDGVVFYCPRDKAIELDNLITAWEQETGFEIERTLYKALYNSSVNTYIAVREDGKIKRKGYIADPWSEGNLRGQMMKNPQMTICSEAIVQYLKEGTPFDQTIKTSTDPRQFVTVIKVTNGAIWRKHYLGRAIRYYWSIYGEPILTEGRKVPKTEGARPLLELTNELPLDLDLLRYHEETVKMAVDLGITFTA